MLASMHSKACDTPLQSVSTESLDHYGSENNCLPTVSRLSVSASTDYGMVTPCSLDDSCEEYFTIDVHWAENVPNDPSVYPCAEGEHSNHRGSHGHILPNVACHPENTFAKDSCEVINDVLDTSHTPHKHSTAPNDPKNETSSSETSVFGEISESDQAQKVTYNCNHIVHDPCVTGFIILLSMDEEYKVNTCWGTVYRSCGDAPQTASLCWPEQCPMGDDPKSHCVSCSTNFLFHSPHPDPGGPCTPGLLFEIYRCTEGCYVHTDFTVGIMKCIGDVEQDVSNVWHSYDDFKENVEYATSADSVCNDSLCNRYDAKADPHKETQHHSYATYSASCASGMSCEEVDFAKVPTDIPFVGISSGVLKACVTQSTSQSELYNCGVHGGRTGPTGSNGLSNQVTMTCIPASCNGASRPQVGGGTAVKSNDEHES